MFYGNQKKYLTNDNNLCSDNINSGARIDNSIYLWRKEEFYKVLIHELIHLFDVDFYISDSVYQKIEKIFNNTFNVNGFDRVNECYTEAFAVLLHSIIYSIETNLSSIKYFKEIKRDIKESLLNINNK